MSGRNVTPAHSRLGNTYVVPAAGEDVSSVSIELATSSTAGGVLWAQDQVDALGSLVPGYSSTDVYTVQIPLASGAWVANWSRTLGSATARTVLTDGGIVGSSLVFELLPYLPPQGKITAFSVFLQGASGHAGLPAIMPAATLFNGTFFSTALASLVSATDGSGSTASYEAVHVMGTSGLSLSIDNSKQYYLLFSGEHSTNALAGLQVSAVQFTCTG